MVGPVYRARRLATKEPASRRRRAGRRRARLELRRAEGSDEPLIAHLRLPHARLRSDADDLLAMRVLARAAPGRW